MVLDAKTAHLHAAAGRELYIKLPPEAGGGYARLLRSLYGMRDAPQLWENYLAEQRQALGFRRGRANACVYHCKARSLKGMVHGDDLTFVGRKRDLLWLYRALEATVLLKLVGVLGSAADELQELRVLNRVIRLDSSGLSYRG